MFSRNDNFTLDLYDTLNISSKHYKYLSANTNVTMKYILDNVNCIDEWDWKELSQTLTH